jgi:arginine repressor
MTELEQAMARLSRSASSHLRLGISPHAPYTVSERLYRAVDDLARGAGLPVAMHLAESRAETQLVQEGSGPFADALRARGIQVARVARSPVQYLAQLGVLNGGTACLCIHCVQVDQEDVVLLTRAGVSIAHCPRSNRAHGHGTAPLAAFRRAGLRVGLGTDSVVSVGDSSLWAEAAAAGLDGEDALRMLTRSCSLSLYRPFPPSAARCRLVDRRRRTRGSRLDSGPMKTQRHAAILKIVRSETVASQEQLRELLKAEGFDVTQATLSRDIRELGLAKVAAPDGGSHYAPPPEAGTAIRPHLGQLLPAVLVSVDGVGPLLVVKTPAGGAQGLGLAIDAAGWTEIIGTIAGDDAVLIITKSERARRAVQTRIKELAGLPA